MKYCSKCGAEIHDEAVVCVNCGCQVEKAYSADDKPSVGLNILGFLIPLVGLIMWLCFRKEQPVKASAIGKWSLIGWAVAFVLNLFLLM